MPVPKPRIVIRSIPRPRDARFYPLKAGDAGYFLALVCDTSQVYGMNMKQVCAKMKM
jgi:alpha-D-ribose 1-methylphosphonate 5-triphosphate synthase subunit PhnI